MPALRSYDLFPFAVIGVITLIAFIVFWSVMDMVLLGGSLAIVLMPLHHRLSARVRPHFSAAIITGGVLAVFAGAAYITLMILTANAATLTSMFTSIGTWLNDPATNPISYGVPLSKATLSSLLSEGNEIFVDYEKTLIANLYLILFKMFVFFFSLSALLFHGDWLKERFMSHMPPVICEWVTRLSAVTVDTLYAIYVVQVAIAVLTFFIALPVFYLLGYGNILFLPCRFLRTHPGPRVLRNVPPRWCLCACTGRCEGRLYHVLPRLPDRIVRAGNLRPPRAGGQAR